MKSEVGRGDGEVWMRRIALGLMSLAAVGLMACEQPNWQDTNYVNEKLESSDPTAQQMALSKLDQLPDEKLPEVVPGLVSVYMSGSSNQKDAMQQLVQLRVPEASEAYLEEVKTDATGYAGAAAEALGETKSEDTIPQLLELYRTTDSSDVKQGILRGFTYMPDARMVDPLVETLSLDVDNHPIALHAYSCEILGEIGQEEPSAFDDADVEAVVRAQYLANKAGQNVSKDCGLAIQQLGEKAVPTLLKTFKQENEAVQKVMMKFNEQPNYDFPANRPTVKAAQRLTTLRAEEAVGPFIDSLKETKEAPNHLKGNHAVSWRKFEGQMTDEVILGLGDIGAEKAQGLLEDVVTGEYTTDEWDEITDWSIELQLRQDAANSLVRLGTRDSTDELMEMAREGVIVDLEKRAAMLEGRDDMENMKAEQRYQFNWMAAKAWANLAEGDQLGELQKLIDETESEGLTKKYESFVPMVEAAQECMEGEPKAQANCWSEKLQSDNELVREKAAWEIQRLPQEIAGPLLVEHLDTESLGTREILEVGLYRAPSQEAIDKIDTILEDEKNNSGEAYKLDHFRLKLARAWLKNNVG